MGITIRPDPMRRVVRTLALVFGNVLFDLDWIWNLGGSAAAWAVRVGFNLLILGEVVLARGEVDRVSLAEPVLARAVGRGDAWQLVAVLFSDTRVVALRRSYLSGSIAELLAEAPRSAVHVQLVRHGAFVDRVRCDWADGRQMRLRFRSGELGRLGFSQATLRSASRGPVAHVVDWVRAGTTYEE